MNIARKISMKRKVSRRLNLGLSQCELIDVIDVTDFPVEPNNSFNVTDFVQNKGWEGVSLNSLYQLRDLELISPFHYTEISLAWVQHHRPSNDQMNQIWLSFKAADLNSRYLWDLKNHLVDDLQYSLDDHHICNNKIACYSFSCNTIQLRNMKESWHVWFGCPVKHCVHSRNHAVKLQIQNAVPLYLIDKKIKYPAPTKVTFRHYHPGAVIHWWGWTDTWKYRKISQFKDLTEFDSLDDEYCRRSFVSMVTNSMDEFIEKLNKGGWRYIACMVSVK